MQRANLNMSIRMTCRAAGLGATPGLLGGCSRRQRVEHEIEREPRLVTLGCGSV